MQANDGVLTRLQCNLCHRTTHFLASDLVKVLDPQRPAVAVFIPLLPVQFGPLYRR